MLEAKLLRNEGITMTQFEIEIKDPSGFHLRSASYVVKEAKKYNCNILIGKDDKTADAKNAFEILELMIKQGDVITFTVSGKGEEQAADKLHASVEGKL